MKNSLSLTALILSVSALVSCGGKDKTATTDVLLDSNSMKTNVLPQANTVPTTTTTPNTGTPNVVTPTTTTINPITITPAPVGQTTAAGLNPAHGQPGHRCDITVGAPLNSKPAAASPNPIQMTAPTTTSI